MFGKWTSKRRPEKAAGNNPEKARLGGAAQQQQGGRSGDMMCREAVPANQSAAGVLRGDLMVKTVLCQYYTQGICSLRSADCRFAHGIAELRKKPNLNHMNLCEKFKSDGFCEQGESCPFLHVFDDVRITGSEPCRFFALGACKNGEFCRFLHVRLVDECGTVIPLTPEVMRFLPVDKIVADEVSSTDAANATRKEAACHGHTLLVEDPISTLGRALPPKYVTSVTGLFSGSSKPSRSKMRRYFHNRGIGGKLIVLDSPGVGKPGGRAPPSLEVSGQQQLVVCDASRATPYTSLHSSACGGSRVGSGRAASSANSSSSSVAQTPAEKRPTSRFDDTPVSVQSGGAGGVPGGTAGGGLPPTGRQTGHSGREAGVGYISTSSASSCGVANAREWHSSDGGGATCASRGSAAGLPAGQRKAEGEVRPSGIHKMSKSACFEVGRLAVWITRRLPEVGGDPMKRAEAGLYSLRKVAKPVFKGFCTEGDSVQAEAARQKSVQMMLEAVHRAIDKMDRMALSHMLFRVLASSSPAENTVDKMTADAEAEGALLDMMAEVHGLR